MKNLNFVFKNNDEILYNEDIQYELDGDYIVFKIEKNVFRLDLKEKIHIVKETDEDIFEIKREEDKVKSFYTLKTHNLTYEVNVVRFDYSFRDKIHNIKYNIESDPDSVKEIILTLS